MAEEAHNYLTLSKNGESLYKEKGSKFLGFAEAVQSVDQAKVRIQSLRELHPKACHVCFAWRIGADQISERFSDDGEPNNSAGKPIFGQIVKHELTNVLIAVVRYYGGTNLGVGGLITAYKTSASDAIADAEIVLKEIEVQIIVRFEQSVTGEAMSILNKSNTTILEHGFDEKGSYIKGLAKKTQVAELENLIKVSHLIELTICS